MERGEVARMSRCRKVGLGKPAPDIFIEAARRIGVSPGECRAYEDGESGLLSAYRAGCHVIDVTWTDWYISTQSQTCKF